MGNQPSGLTCGISKGSGTLASAAVIDVAVNCSTNTYSVGGSISGLGGASDLVLGNNGTESLSVAANASTFTLTKQVPSGSAYAVTVLTQPKGLNCTVANGSGTVEAANVSSVAVSCIAAPTYSVGGSIAGLGNTGLTLSNGGENLSIAANAGSFAFANLLSPGTDYNVTVGTQPTSQICSVVNGTGTVATGNVNSVAVNCSVPTTTTSTSTSTSSTSTTTSTTTTTITPSVSALTDTGITASQCYAAGSDALASCTSAAALALNNAQDGMIGRDVTTPDNTDGKLGFSYSTVGSNPTTDCVKDNITGLTWEGKPATDALRAASKTYTNLNDRSAGDASTYITAVNAAQLCGYSDWRLPTSDELQSLVDYSVASPGPTIDANWFANTQSNWYWSSSPYAGIASFAWYVVFYDGYVDYGNRTYGGRVRLVR